MTTILITGAAGFIGFNVAKELLKRGDTLVGIDNMNNYYDVSLKEARIEELKRLPGFTFVKADITDQEDIKVMFKEHRPEKVCHLAAQAGVRYSLENPFAYEETNNKGTLTLLEACRHHKVKHFIFASSSSIYGNNKKLPFSENDRVDTPISVYAATKKYNEVLAHAYNYLFGIHCTGLRFFTVYGPWGRPDMALFKFTKNILEGKQIQVFNKGNHRRDFTFITDIVQGVVAAIDRSEQHQYEVFNLARGESVELMAYIKAIEKTLGKKAVIEFLPLQQGDVPETSADITKAKKMLGYNPRVSIEEGVRRFIDWYKKFYTK